MKVDRWVHIYSTKDKLVSEEVDTVPVPQWIPVTERLPEDNTEVFVYLFDNQPYIAWICDGHWRTEEFEVERENEPVAWCALPEPWEGGKT